MTRPARIENVFLFYEDQKNAERYPHRIQLDISFSAIDVKTSCMGIYLNLRVSCNTHVEHCGWKAESNLLDCANMSIHHPILFRKRGTTVLHR